MCLEATVNLSETLTVRILPYFNGNRPLNTKYGNGDIHTENDPTWN